MGVAVPCSHTRTTITGGPEATVLLSEVPGSLHGMETSRGRPKGQQRAGGLSTHVTALKNVSACCCHRSERQDVGNVAGKPGHVP